MRGPVGVVTSLAHATNDAKPIDLRLQDGSSESEGYLEPQIPYHPDAPSETLANANPQVSKVAVWA